MTTTAHVADTPRTLLPRPVVRVGIVGEFRQEFPPHRAVHANLTAVCRSCPWEVHSEWVATDTLEDDVAGVLQEYDALWIAPGSPYRSLDGALAAIRHARERSVPLLGTCGGFQHIIVEFARNVLGLREAGHAETAPDAECLAVTALACSPAGQSMAVRLNTESRLAGWYGREEIVEQYFCNYGINPAFEDDIHAAGLRIVGRDEAREPRVVDLDGHPFFIGALYVPQPAPGTNDAHPLVTQLVAAGAAAGAHR